MAEVAAKTETPRRHADFNSRGPAHYICVGVGVLIAIIGPLIWGLPVLPGTVVVGLFFIVAGLLAERWNHKEKDWQAYATHVHDTAEPSVRDVRIEKCKEGDASWLEVFLFPQTVSQEEELKYRSLNKEQPAFKNPLAQKLSIVAATRLFLGPVAGYHHNVLVRQDEDCRAVILEFDGIRLWCRSPKYSHRAVSTDKPPSGELD